MLEGFAPYARLAVKNATLLVMQAESKKQIDSMSPVDLAVFANEMIEERDNQRRRALSEFKASRK